MEYSPEKLDHILCQLPAHRFLHLTSVGRRNAPHRQQKESTERFHTIEIFFVVVPVWSGIFICTFRTITSYSMKYGVRETDSQQQIAFAMFINYAIEMFPLIVIN